MPFLFRCRDIKLSDSFEITDDSYEELIKLVELHAQNSHRVQEISPELKQQIAHAVRVVPA